ncbi:MAG TPA: ATP-binding protein, partial [Candidatus Sulfopaludibacter sp.]|nr:ATP-binding protein [Candidatus Sulfopaludibacter sp.]
MPQSTILDETRLSLDGDLKELERLAVWIRGFRERHSLSEDAGFRLNLALEELFTNAVRHGGCNGMLDAVSMGLQLAGGEVGVEYSDRGQPFDPADAPPPDLDS